MAPQRPAARTRDAGRPNGNGEAPARPQAKPAPNPNRVGKPPEDPQLNSLLRSFIRQTNDDARADTVYGEIVARAAESAALNSEVVEMFKLMLSFRDRYGTTHAQSLAEGFLKEHLAPAAATPAAPEPEAKE